MSLLERIFKLKEHNTTLKTEVIAGGTTFAAMAYILAVNPGILSSTGMDFGGLVTVTALAAIIGSLAMALMTNYPIALAPGMGLNAYIAFTVCGEMGITWQAAMGMVFWNGILFLILSLTGIRTLVVNAIPRNLKIGVTAGIGLFIAFIGLQKSGLIVSDPATLVSLGDLSTGGPLLALIGIIITAVLVQRKIPGGIMLGILLITGIGFFIYQDGSPLTAKPDSWFGLPNGIGETFFALDLSYPFTHWEQSWKIILTLCFVDMFDTVGTLIGVSQRAKLLDKNGNLPRMGQALTADAVATSAGALLGTSPTTSFIESAAGVEEGGRTGLTAVVVAACFGLALFFSPVIQIVPDVATAPALIVVGFFMIQGLKDLDLGDFAQAVPALVALLFMPLAYSISEGIALGFIIYVGVMLGIGRAREVSALAYLLALLFLAHYIFL